MQYEKPPGYNISVPVFQPIAPSSYFDNRLPQMATPDAGNLIRPLAEGIATAIMSKPKLDAQRQQTQTQADLLKKMEDPSYSGMIKLGPGGATLDPSLPGEMAYRQAAIEAQKANTGYRQAAADFMSRRDPNATKGKTSQTGWSSLDTGGGAYIANDQAPDDGMPVSRGAFNPNDPNSAPMGLIVPDNPEAMIDAGADLSQATPTPTDFTLPNTSRNPTIQPAMADLSQVDPSFLTASVSSVGVPTGPLPTVNQPFSLELSNEPVAVDLSDAGPTMTPTNPQPRSNNPKAPSPPIYGYPVSEWDGVPPQIQKYLQDNPQVAGMAWGGGENGSDPDSPRVLIANQFNPMMSDPTKRDGLLRIEAARHKMSESGYAPDFEITPQQQEWRKNLGPYATDDGAFKQSIVSRIIGGESVPGVSAEQIASAGKVAESMRNPSSNTAATAPKASSPISIPTMDERIESASSRIRARKPIEQTPNGTPIYQDENGTRFLFGGIVPDENGIPHEVRGYQGEAKTVKIPLIRPQKLSQKVQDKLMESDIPFDEYTTPREAMAALQSAKKESGATGEKLTEAQSKNAQGALLARDAINEVKRLEAKGFKRESAAGARDVTFAEFPILNQLSSDDGQSYYTAVKSFTESILRPKSGATIREEEYDNYERQYFPRYGDKPNTIAAKEKRRELAIEGLKMGLPAGVINSMANTITGDNFKDADKLIRGMSQDGSNPQMPSTQPNSTTSTSQQYQSGIDPRISAITSDPKLSVEQKKAKLNELRAGALKPSANPEPVAAQETPAEPETPAVESENPTPAPTPTVKRRRIQAPSNRDTSASADAGRAVAASLSQVTVPEIWDPRRNSISGPTVRAGLNLNNLIARKTEDFLGGAIDATGRFFKGATE